MQNNKNEEDLLIQAKILDKINLCKTRNKITYTDFLDLHQISIAESIIKNEKITNYFFFGGKEDSDRSILIIYPEKINLDIARNGISNIMEVVRIILPNELVGKYEHRDYLSGIMKLGIKREKFGDIIITNNGAEIVALKEISEYIMINLQQLTRFKKSKITLIDVGDLSKKETEFEEFKIVVSSIRLDNFVSELAKCSRSKAIEIIETGRVFINSINELKVSKKLLENDVITIRGKGKFIFFSTDRTTKSGKQVINIKKYV